MTETLDETPAMLPETDDECSLRSFAGVLSSQGRYPLPQIASVRGCLVGPLLMADIDGQRGKQEDHRAESRIKHITQDSQHSLVFWI
jgi:hypothetical protein